MPTAEMELIDLGTPETDESLVSPPESEEDALLAWKPRGSWIWQGSNPAALGSDSDGSLLLSLSISTNRPVLLGELSHFAEGQDERARAAVLAALQSDECWPSFIESKAEIDGTQKEIDNLEAERQKLERERVQLAAKPKGAGKRLAEIAKLQSDLANRIQGARLEIAALRPIFDQAKQRAETRARQIAMEVTRDIRAEEQKVLDAALVEFYQRHTDELTAIAARIHARRCRSNESWVGSLRTFALGHLQRAEPLPDPAATV